jgi:hypothetical protein
MQVVSHLLDEEFEECIWLVGNTLGFGFISHLALDFFNLILCEEVWSIS